MNAPGIADVAFVNDPLSGRLNSVQMPGSSIDMTYYGATGATDCPVADCAPGKPRTLTDSRSGTSTTFGWTGSLPKNVQQGTAKVSWGYNNDLRLTDETLVKGTTTKVTFNYDPDGLPICASLGTCAAGQTERMELTPDTASGRLTTLTLGTGTTAVVETFGYNTYGELKWQSGSPLRIDYEDEVSATKVPRDAMGRVKRRIERVGAGASKSFDYTYDNQGRLWKVGGAATSEYRYDDNGNRTYAKSSTGTVDAALGDIAYDDQDRLLQYGNVGFEYSLKGDLKRRVGPDGEYSYDYDALGSLRSVVLPNGSTIDYLVDGLGRRVGRKVNGVLSKQWVYGAGLGPLAELDGAGTVTMRFIYASKPNIPDFVKTYAATGNKLYRIFSDQLGTPRVVYDVAAKSIFEATDFDEFGIKLMTDTNATFELPFGFAGGLYDSDTKLTRFGARDYDASVGRWVSKDPIFFGGGQANLYVYVGNDPINATDVTGLLEGVPDWLEDLDNSGWLQAAGYFSAGVSGTLTMGLSDYLIEATGLDEYGSVCSSARAIGEIAGLAGGLTASAASAANLSIRAGRYANAGGGGVSLLRNGKRIFGADWHTFKLGERSVNRPHLHLGKTNAQLKKHWPWQTKGGGGFRLPWD